MRVGTASRPVRMSLGIAVFAAVVFAVNLPAAHGPAVLLWLAPCGSVVVPSVLAWRAARMPLQPAPTRRFWRTLAACLVLAGVGATSHGYDTISTGTSGRHMSIATVSVYGATMTLLLWSLLRLPMGATRRGDVLRLALDAGTVLIAGAAFLWHYTARPTLETTGYRPATMLAMVVTLLIELVTVFALIKVALAGQAYVARSALRLLAAALLVGALSSLLQVFVQDRPHLDMVQLTLPAIMVCVTAAAERQLRAGTGRAPSQQPAKRQFSRLPYLAVAAIDLLLVVTVESGVDATPTALAVVALTALVMWRQLTALRENSELLSRLDHSATHDTLTGLPNRALFNERLTTALADADPGRGVGVALIDLDDFKIINDTLGHAAGDVLLVGVAQRLRACLRPGDTAARLGGDEFVVLLRDVTPDEAEQVTRRVIDALVEPVVAEDHHLLVRASIGVAEGRSGDDAGELLRRADIAMYAAKHGGGSKVERYRPGLAATVADSAEMGAELQQAIAERRLFLEYQPIVSLIDDRTVGVEALIRWSHPTRGVIAPAAFIPVAERTGMIVELGGWVLQEACRQFAVWCAELDSRAPAGINVNVSPRQLSDRSFVTRVAEVLAATGLPGHRLTLEITDSSAVDLSAVAPRVQALRDLGVRIALDDFGAGPSSLTALLELPVDQLKLDRAFLGRGGTGFAMPEAVLALARAADLEIVAEGVETPQQADELRAYGYRSAQGFHFARPMPADRFGRHLAGPPVDDVVAAGTGS
ncbi:EAL domain-containing protein [Actinoplanes sp. NPDC023801]|uniref:putative bifunctional diguanylate cyclase/phosphodiesterase n=1 Tax=Actinoplanes sp. NPDC023801 TaxID=3154595 RepID=UPI0033F6DBAA